MFSKMMQLVNRNDMLPLTPPQQKEILDYAKSLAARFEAARRVEQAERKLIDSAAKYVLEAVPELGDFADAGWTGYGNDLQFVLRSITQGMLLDDDDFARTTAVGSLARELGYLDLPKTTVAEVVTGLRLACQELLPPASSETLSPYFEAATAVAA